MPGQLSAARLVCLQRQDDLGIVQFCSFFKQIASPRRPSTVCGKCLGDGRGGEFELGYANSVPVVPGLYRRLLREDPAGLGGAEVTSGPAPFRACAIGSLLLFSSASSSPSNGSATIEDL